MSLPHLPGGDAPGCLAMGTWPYLLPSPPCSHAGPSAPQHLLGGPPQGPRHRAGERACQPPLPFSGLLRAQPEGTTFIHKPGRGWQVLGERWQTTWPQPPSQVPPARSPALSPWAEPPGPPPACPHCRRFPSTCSGEISVWVTGRICNRHSVDPGTLPGHRPLPGSGRPGRPSRPSAARGPHRPSRWR